MIGKAIGCYRRTVDSYIADLRTIVQMDLGLKIFRMMRLGMPQERIAKRLGLARTMMESHLTKMATLPFSSNADLSKGYAVPQVAESMDGRNR